MLAVDFLEFLRCGLRILPLNHQVQALIIELVGGFLDKGIVLGHELVPQRAGAAAAKGERENNETGGEPQLPADPAEAGAIRYLAQFERHTLCRHESET